MKNIILVNDWEELEAFNLENDEYKVEVEFDDAWIESKTGFKCGFYLSPSSFNSSNYGLSTRILQACGFNVQLKNWGGETIWIKEE